MTPGKPSDDATPFASANRARVAGARGANVAFRGIAKRYGDLQALAPTTLDIESGEFFSLIGPSGSGKTTLLGVTAGFIPPSGGGIQIDGEDIIGISPFRRNIGMVFQNYSLFPHMTVAENIGFPLRMRREGRAAIGERVNRMLGMVRLEGLGDRRPAELSGGQQQRVALARAAIYDPLLLLMDEPLSALDKNLREEMQDEIKQFQEALGATVIYVTHDQSEAAAMSHRIAIMNAGQIEQVGTPRDLYERPVNRFVAGFLGEANIFKVASVEAAASGSVVTTADGLRLAAEAILPAGQALCACVRPETIALSRGEATGDNIVPGGIEDVTYTAGSIRYRVHTGPGTVLTVREPSERGHALPPIGSEVTLSWRAGDTLLIADED